MRIVPWLCTLSAILFALMPARESLAHHSFAMYDMTKVVVITGTVREFQWTNPHALLWVTGSVTDGGAADLWAIELPTSPGNLGRMGWTKHSLATGDPLTLEINPLRDGSHGGSFKKATLTKTGVVLVANPFKDSDGGYPSADVDGSTDDAATLEAGEAGTAAGGDKAAKCSVSGGARAGSSSLGPALLGVLAVAMERRARRRGERRRRAMDALQPSLCG
jgi:hypothetical protein